MGGKGSIGKVEHGRGGEHWEGGAWEGKGGEH